MNNVEKPTVVPQNTVASGTSNEASAVAKKADPIKAAPKAKNLPAKPLAQSNESLEGSSNGVAPQVDSTPKVNTAPKRKTPTKPKVAKNPVPGQETSSQNEDPAVESAVPTLNTISPEVAAPEVAAPSAAKPKSRKKTPKPAQASSQGPAATVPVVDTEPATVPDVATVPAVVPQSPNSELNGNKTAAKQAQSFKAPKKKPTKNNNTNTPKKSKKAAQTPAQTPTETPNQTPAQ